MRCRLCLKELDKIRHVTGGISIPVTRPQSPSKASISRTICPLPIPPRNSEPIGSLRSLEFYPSKGCMNILQFCLDLGSQGLSLLQLGRRLHTPRSLHGLRQLRKHQILGAAESRQQEKRNSYSVAVAIDFERSLSNRRQIAAEAFCRNKIRSAKTLFGRVIYLEDLETSILAMG